MGVLQGVAASDELASAKATGDGRPVSRGGTVSTPEYPQDGEASVTSSTLWM